MTPYYQDEQSTIYCGDCREILPELGRFDLLLTDPPYGIGYDATTSTQRGIQQFEKIAGEDELFDPSPFIGFYDCILWGCNHFCHAIPPKIGQWYFWDKVVQNGQKVRIAEGEFCWHKQGTKPRCFRHLWSGAYRASEAGEPSQHPHQKPTMLLKWSIGLSPTSGDILDPFMGSGTTLVAAKLEGRKAVGIELEERYCEIAAKRLAQGVLILTPTDIKNDLAAIARPRPLLMGLLKKDVQGKTLGSIWAAILANEKITKQTFLADVLGEFVDRQRLVPDPMDALCDLIQAEANSRYWRAWERHQQEMKVHRPFKDKQYADNEWGRAYRLIAYLRTVPCDWRNKRQSISEVEMDEALGWVNGRGERPEWLTI